MALGGVILSAAYFLGFFQRAFLGPVASPELAFALDLRPRELLVAGVLGLLVLTGGLFPQWVQGVTAGASNAWVARLAVGQQVEGSAAMAGYNAHEFKPPQ